MASIMGACAVGRPVTSLRTTGSTTCAPFGRPRECDPDTRCFLPGTRASATTPWSLASAAADRRCDTCRLLAARSEGEGVRDLAAAAAAGDRFRSASAFSAGCTLRTPTSSLDNDDGSDGGGRLYKKTSFLSDWAVVPSRGERRGGGSWRRRSSGGGGGGGGGSGAAGVARAAAAPSSDSASSIKPLAESEEIQVLGEGGRLCEKIPAAPGVYAIYDKTGTLQYVGISRKVSLSLANHAARLPDLVATVKIATVDGPDREALQAAWKAWVEEHLSVVGSIPPGNVPGENVWKESARRPPKADLRLTPGAHVPLTVSMETLIDSVVKQTPIVAFIKGTRTTPQCGFSHRVLMVLNKEGVDYETVNVLDEEFNPGVREAIKTYSKWPTIPQVFINGDLIGGADLLEESVEKGEFKQLLAAGKSKK